MNLLIEQRPSTLTSSKSQPPSQIANENDMNNSSSPSSPLVLKIKRQTTKQHSHELHSPSSHMSEEEQQQQQQQHHHHSPSTHSLQRLKRSSLPQTTATRRPSSPAFNGKQQQATKRAVTIDNNNNDLTSHIDDISATKRFKRDDSNCSSSNKVDACVETVSVGLATEPDHLGPCEPGTSVVLEGIVWNETDSGVLVVNVTWRGKTYVGTLLDSTKQDWACPRLTCESPTSDYDPRSTSKTSRSKRNGAGGTARCAAQQAVSLCQQITSSTVTVGVDDRKLRNNIKSRQSKRLSNLSATITEEVTNQSSPLTSPYRTTNQAFFPPDGAATTPTANAESQLISCSEPQCHKRFASTIALNYHLSNAHKKTEPTAIIPQANTRDEEDVAHILANVADYVRRTSPPSSMRCSPEHHQQAALSPAIVHSPPSNVKTLDNGSPAPLAWPCPQISSKLVLPSSMNNTERAPSPNSTRCTANNTDTSLLESKPIGEPDEPKSSTRPADHFLLHVQDQVAASTNPSSPSSSADSSTKKDSTSQKKRQKAPTPPPPPPPPPPPALTASSPAYSDISDEEPTTDEQTLPPSTVNLLTGTNGKIDENGNSLHSSSSTSFLTSADLTNPAWTAQMLFQQFGPLMQQQALATAAISSNKDLSTTPNRLNSNSTCPASNGTSDSTVKNILDARRSSTSKISSTSSSPPLPPPPGLYHYPTSNESKFPTPIINTLTSPNENLLHLSSSSSTSPSPSTASTAIKPMDILDYSLNNSRASNNGGQYHHSSSLHPSR